ncbi:MAG: SGNH/GDSL hydrolase family protein [Betaproteobacteria bacterium]
MLLLGCLSLTLPAGDQPAAQARYSRIVVFGTSLSDPGNAFALVGGTNTPPDYLTDPFLVPSAPYARGGHHFTNGATWVEQLARPLGLAGTVRPAFLASSGASNYAVGAARAYDDGVNVDLSVQVTAFLQQFGGSAPSDALYAIEMGGNDIRDALVAYSNGLDGGAILTAALTSIAGHIGTLYAAGARDFLVWNAPNVGLTPAIRALDALNPGVAAFGQLLTQTFDAQLAVLLNQLSALPGIRIVRFDAYQLLSDIVADPGGFGMTDVTTACITPGDPPFTCQTPDQFLFWDGIHPTKATHAIIAQKIARALAY